MHLNVISYAFSSAGTILHLNAISYAFSSTGAFNFFNLFLVPLLVLLGSLIFSSTGTINFSSAGTFLHLNTISYAFSSATILVPLQILVVF